MPAGTPSNITLGAGTLYIAATSSTEPTDLATAWPGAWVQLGYTEDGSAFNYNLDTQEIMVAEELDPIKYSSVKRTISIDFNLAEITALNLQRALNGGSIALSGGVNTFLPPALGAETRRMIGWQALDGLERWVFRQCLQRGQIKIERKKAPAFAKIPCSFGVEKPASLDPFKVLIDSSRA